MRAGATHVKNKDLRNLLMIGEVNAHSLELELHLLVGKRRKRLHLEHLAHARGHGAEIEAAQDDGRRVPVEDLHVGLAVDERFGRQVALVKCLDGCVWW